MSATARRKVAASCSGLYHAERPCSDQVCLPNRPREESGISRAPDILPAFRHRTSRHILPRYRNADRLGVLFNLDIGDYYRAIHVGKPQDVGGIYIAGLGKT